MTSSQVCNQSLQTSREMGKFEWLQTHTHTQSHLLGCPGEDELPPTPGECHLHEFLNSKDPHCQWRQERGSPEKPCDGKQLGWVRSSLEDQLSQTPKPFKKRKRKKLNQAKFSPHSLEILSVCFLFLISELKMIWSRGSQPWLLI